MIALLTLLSVHAEDDWLSLTSIGGRLWGSTEVPAGAARRSQSDYLPDSGYIGQQASDRPADYELIAPAGERRFARYAHDQLVDAWLVRDGRIDLSALTHSAEPEWAGVVLGPAEEAGWRALGYARSWVVSDRTLLHWEDRLSDTEIVAFRASPTSGYGVQRAAPVGSGSHASTRTVRLSGPLRSIFKPHADALSGCLSTAPKPVEARLQIRYDGTGRPGRLRVETDQPSFNVVDCMAGVIEGTRQEAFSEGEVVIYRTR